MFEHELITQGAEALSLFCRLNINKKNNFPIRSSEMGLLIFSATSEDPVTPVTAANFFRVKKPMITAMVNKLTEEDYLKKSPSLKDKRSYTLTPTKKGQSLVNEAYEDYFKTVEILKNRLGKEEYQQLIALIEKSNLILLEEKDNG